jgi:hypothetical protein
MSVIVQERVPGYSDMHGTRNGTALLTPVKKTHEVDMLHAFQQSRFYYLTF